MPPRAAAGHSGRMQQTTQPAVLLRVYVVEDSLLIRERLDAMIVVAGAAVAGHASTAGAAICSILAERLGAKGFFDKSREFDLMGEVIAQRAAAVH